MLVDSGTVTGATKGDFTWDALEMRRERYAKNVAMTQSEGSRDA